MCVYVLLGMDLKLNEESHHHNDKEVTLNSIDNSYCPSLHPAFKIKIMCLSSVIWSQILRGFRIPIKSKRHVINTVR